MMASAKLPLNTAQTMRLQQAFALLQARKPSDALVLAQQLVQEAPDTADVHQLLALCLAETQQPADAAFQRALSLASSPVIACNYATWLRKQRRFADAATVLEQVPATEQTSLLLGATLLELNAYARAARAYQHALTFRPGIQAWHGLGSALRADDDWEGAASAFGEVLALDANYAPAWVNLGAVQRLLGRLDDATRSFQRARSLGLDTPDVRNALNGLLSDAGEPAQALQGARALTREAPSFAPAWEALTELLWEHGGEADANDDPLAPLQHAAQAQPGNEALQFTYVRALRAAHRDADALAIILAMRQRGQGGVYSDWLEADARNALGQFNQAQVLFEKAQKNLATNVDFLNAYARYAFRSQRFELALDCAIKATQLAPHDQEAWANLGTAWRLTEDAREDWLFGYEHLIGFAQIEPPAGFTSLPAFLSALSETLHRLHGAVREPLEQSVRGGTQTSGLLFGRNDAMIRSIEATLRHAVERHIAALPDDPNHPFLARKRNSVRFSGSWSVRLKSAGHHASHFHNKGWMSSAFYVSLPSSVANAADNPHHAAPGSIHFGKPHEYLGLDLPPRRIIRPQAGYLALFPSYLWHGTVPFTDDEPRLTIAFDMLPA